MTEDEIRYAIRSKVSSDDYNVVELANALKILLDEMNKSRLMELRLPKETVQELEDLSKTREESVEILIKEAIIKYLEGETGTERATKVEGDEKTLLIGLDADIAPSKDKDEETPELEEDMADIDEDYLITHGYSEVEATDDVIGLRKSPPISEFKDEDEDIIEGIGSLNDSEIIDRREIDRDDLVLEEDELEDEIEEPIEINGSIDDVEEVEAEIDEDLVEVVEDVELAEDEDDLDEVEVELDGEVIEIVNDDEEPVEITSSDLDDLGEEDESLEVEIDDEISTDAEDLDDHEDIDKDTYDELMDLEETSRGRPKIANIEEEILKALEAKESAELADQEETTKPKTSKKKGRIKTKKKGKVGSTSKKSQAKKKSSKSKSK
jgi:hypothetical protein